jgi:hypothetical protein
MSKLHQIISVIKTRKADAEKALTEAYHKFQAKELMVGLSRTFHLLPKVLSQNTSLTKRNLCRPR